MISIATDLRAQASDLRTKADKLDAIAASIDGGALSPDSFCGDARPRALVQAVADACGIEYSCIIGKGRRAETTVARHIAAHALRHLLGMRLEDISGVLHRGGHDAIVHALRAVRSRRSTEKHFAEKLERCMRAAHAVLANLEGIAA